MTFALPDGSSLYYASAGEGPPLLLLHGGLGLDQSTLRPWLDGLASSARLIYVDLRGCGHSSPLAPGAGASHLDWIADLDALRAHLNIDRWTVFGHSYGSFLALEYALAFPQRLGALILCSAAPAFTHAEAAMANAQARASPETLGVLANALAGPVASDADFEAVWRALAPLYLHRPETATLSAISDGVRYRAGAFNASFFSCLPHYDVRSRLAEITVPTLVISGRHDWINPPEHGAIPLAQALPNADLVLLEESGHFPFVEEPEVFEQAVTRWLATHHHSAP